MCVVARSLFIVLQSLHVQRFATNILSFICLYVFVSLWQRGFPANLSRIIEYATVGEFCCNDIFGLSAPTARGAQPWNLQPSIQKLLAGFSNALQCNLYLSGALVQCLLCCTLSPTHDDHNAILKIYGCTFVKSSLEPLNQH